MILDRSYFNIFITISGATGTDSVVLVIRLLPDNVQLQKSEDKCTALVAVCEDETKQKK